MINDDVNFGSHTTEKNVKKFPRTQGFHLSWVDVRTFDDILDFVNLPLFEKYTTETCRSVLFS